MNEATFEAAATAQLMRSFPMLKGAAIALQGVLTLRFGHHTITIDGEERQRVHGRYDALVTIDGVPQMLLELKRPGNGITQSDVDQAVSYARLLEHMPPLVVVSDGRETKCVGVVDKRPLDPSVVDQARLMRLVQEGLELAASDRDSAIESLLGGDSALWAKLFRSLSLDALTELTGDADQLTQPLVRDFRIPRDAAAEVSQLVARGGHLVAVVGAPLCGKTNVLAELVEGWSDGETVPLYMDSTHVEIGPIQAIANALSEEVFETRDADVVRGWLVRALPRSKLRLVVLVDGWTQRGQQQQLFELINLMKARRGAVVLAVDEATWLQMAARGGRREPTRVGREAVTVEVEPLSEREFERAQCMLLRRGVAFHQGAVHHAENRAVRLVRLQFATAMSVAGASEVNEEPPAGATAVTMIPPVTEPSLLSAAEAFLPLDRAFAAAYRDLCLACMDQWKVPFGPESMLFAYGAGAVIYDVARVRLGERLETLIRAGHVRIADGPRDTLWVVPLLPELLAASFVPVLAQAVDSEGSADEAYALLCKCDSLPSGDLVAAAVLRRVERSRASSLIALMIADEPRRESPQAGTHVLVRLDGGRQVPYTLDADDVKDSALSSNGFPWLVLARVAGQLSYAGDPAVNLAVWWDLGRYPAPLMRQAPGVTSLETHQIGNLGTYVCENEGVVEPITWSLATGLSQGEVDMAPLAHRAVAEGELFLQLRLRQAARLVSNEVDPAARARANDILAILRPLADNWPGVHGFDSPSEDVERSEEDSDAP